MADKKEDPIRYSRISPDMRGNSTALSHDYVGGNEDIPGRHRRLIDYMAHDREGNSLVYAQVVQTHGQTFTRMTAPERQVRQPPNHLEHLVPPHRRAVNNPPGRPMPSPGDFVHVAQTPIVDLERTDAKSKPVPGKDDYFHDKTNTRPAKPGDQLVMFGIDHKPTRRQVVSLYARDSTPGKLATMNILGIADNASRDALGHGLKPDDNLSTHSLGLVNNLYKKGAIPDKDMPTNSTPSNDLDFSDAAQTLDTQHTSKFDTGELINLNHRLPHAKARIRQILGRSVPTLNTEPKNEQLQLEGFE